MAAGGENFADVGPKNIGKSNPQQAEGLASTGVVPPPGQTAEATKAKLQEAALFTEQTDPTAPPAQIDWTSYADATSRTMKQMVDQNDVQGALSVMDKTIGRAYLMGGDNQFILELGSQLTSNGVATNSALLAAQQSNFQKNGPGMDNVAGTAADTANYIAEQVRRGHIEKAVSTYELSVGAAVRLYGEAKQPDKIHSFAAQLTQDLQRQEVFSKLSNAMRQGVGE